MVYLDAEAVRQLRMGLGWLCLFVEKSDRIVLAGWIVLSGSYLWVLLDLDCIGWIGLDHNDRMRKHSFMHWLVTARMIWMGRMRWMDWMGRWWDWGGTDGR